MTRRHALAFVLAVAALMGFGVAGASASPTASSRAAGSSDSVGASVLIGTGGLTWTDVSEKSTPNLWALLRDGSSAAMSIRSVVANTCPVDGWLGLSAGGRAWSPREPVSKAKTMPCPSLPQVPTSGSVPRWSTYVDAAKDNDFGSTVGTLGQQAAAAKVCVQAVGPGAGLAAATTSGEVKNWEPFAPETLVRALNGCRLAFVDVGALRDPADVAPGEQTSGSRAEQIAAIDQRIGQTVQAAPAGADLIVASLSDAGTTERLRLIVAKGPHFGPGTLNSASTKQPGLVQAQDVTVTLMQLNGIPVPDALGGAVLTSASAPDNSVAGAQARLQHLVDYDLASHEVHSLVPPFFNGFAYGQLVIYLLVLLVWKGKIGSPSSRLTVLRWVRIVAICAASVPASTFLANLLPWWRFSHPMLSIVASVGLFVALIAAFALVGPWGRSTLGPVVVVAAATMAVLAADVMTGSRLQQSSLMGLQPVVAGRFYGMGNVTYGIFVASALLLATAISSWLVRRGRPRVAALATLAIGLFTLVVDGAPFWGADGGGPPATIPGFAFLTLSVLGLKMTWRRIVAIAAGCVAVFLGVATLDWLRPAADRTHLGRFIQSIIDGGALDIVIRKAQQNWSILTGNAPLTLLVPAALLFVIYVLARPTSWGGRGMQKAYRDVPTLRAGLIALVVTLTVGFAINDSGTAIPAVGATVAVPLIVAMLVASLSEEVRAQGDTRRARRRS